jgi:hypothetical protein
LAASRECVKTGRKPFLFRWNRPGQSLWCIFWGGENIQIIVKFEHARMVLARMYGH